MAAPNDAVANLLSEIRRMAVASNSDLNSGYIRTAIEGIDHLGDPDPVESLKMGVVDQHLDDAVGLAGDTTRSLALAIQAAEPNLQWQTSYDEAAHEPVIATMRKGYAYATVVEARESGLHRSAPFVSDDIFIGVTLQAPDIFYPAHSHPAIEVYSVVGGTAEWQHNGGPWAPRPPGSVMVHEANDHHAMQTRSEPLLTWVTWVSDLHIRPVLHLP